MGQVTTWRMQWIPAHPGLALCSALSVAVTPLAGQESSRPASDPDAPVALVTGSTGGLGREVALRLAADGHHVIVHGRDQARGDAVVAEINAGGKGSARFIAADLAALDHGRTLAEIEAYAG